jgi:DNA-damage-inducible protein D
MRQLYSGQALKYGREPGSMPDLCYFAAIGVSMGIHPGKATGDRLKSMKQDLNSQLFQKLERARYTNRELDIWSGRKLQQILGFKDWRSFVKVVEKAKVLCIEAGFQVRDHFSFGSRKMTLGKSGNRKVDEVGLTRYACYLITQNAGLSNKTITFAQTYFSTHTRELGVIEQRLLYLERLPLKSKSENKWSNIIYERGIDEKGFEFFRLSEDEEVFGTYSAKEMKEKLAMSKDTYYAEFVSTLPVMAIDIAIEVTLYNIRQKKLVGEDQISMEYLETSRAFHNMLLERGIKLETFPDAEDIEEVGRDLEHFRRMHIKA